MSDITRTRILRANAIYLGLGAIFGLSMDIAGVFFGMGPQARILHAVPVGPPYEGVGYLEAHGLALIFATVLWRVPPTRGWHLTAMASGILLGTCNLVFWQIFHAAGILAAGYVTTALHWLFAALQLAAAVSASRRANDVRVAAA
jgi:hypothetical protein